MRKYEIKGHATETKRPKKDTVEGCIREIQGRWYRTMFRKYCSKSLWSYGIPYEAKIMQITASFAADLQGRINKRSYCHLGLDNFVREYGAPYNMTYDGAQKQIGRKT